VKRNMVEISLSCSSLHNEISLETIDVAYQTSSQRYGSIWI
jgi:hypothetical protein